MSDPITPAPGTAIQTPETPTDPGTTQPPADGGGSTNADMAKARRKIAALEKANADAVAQAEAMRVAQLSDSEKAQAAAIEAAKDEVRAQYEQQIEKTKRDHAIDTAVVAAGMPPEYAHILRATGEIETLEDIPAAVAKLKGAEWARQPVPGQTPPGTRPPTGKDYPRGGVWDREQVQELRSKGLYAEYRAEIEKHYGVI